MNIAILTTDTTHHSYYVKNMNDLADNVDVFSEKKIISFPFETKHSYELEQESYEINKWFGGVKISLKDVANTYFIESINDSTVKDQFKKARYDAVFVFGTGRINQSLIDVLPIRTFNLHGGDPECYRGLDTHLWSIYHNDFNSLITTIHKLDARLDTGDIICKSRLDIDRNMSLYQLRSVNTEVCIKLSKIVVDSLKESGDVISTKQRKIGRYYSAMPECLKNICKIKFEKYSASLKKK